MKKIAGSDYSAAVFMRALILFVMVCGCVEKPKTNYYVQPAQPIQIARMPIKHIAATIQNMQAGDVAYSTAGAIAIDEKGHIYLDPEYSIEVEESVGWHKLCITRTKTGFSVELLMRDYKFNKYPPFTGYIPVESFTVRE